MKRRILSLVMIPILFLLVSCENSDENPDPSKLEILTPTEVTETGFTVNWLLSEPGTTTSIVLEVSKDEDFKQLAFFSQFENLSLVSMEVSGLRGATRHYYRFHLLADTDTLNTSETARVETTYLQKNMDLFTSDTIKLSASLSYLESLPGKRPGIILMHEFGVWINPWIGSDLLKRMVSEGYICLTFFFRGHGTSTPVDDLEDLLAK